MTSVEKTNDRSPDGRHMVGLDAVVDALGTAYPYYSPLLGALAGFVLARAYDMKVEFEENVCEPMLSELRAVVDGYEDVSNVEIDPYPYYNDEFRSRWTSHVPPDSVSESARRSVPSTLRDRLDRYGTLLGEIQRRHADKATHASEVRAHNSHYQVLQGATPFLFETDEWQFESEVTRYAEICDYNRARDVLEDWEDEPAYLDQYWVERCATIRDCTQGRSVELRGRTRLFWRTFREQRVYYLWLKLCARELIETLETERSRGVAGYALRRGWTLVTDDESRSGTTS